MKMSDVSVITKQHLNGNGLGSVVPSLQNALFMAPQAGDTWTKKADMPTARSIFFSSEVNGKIYAIGGYDGIKELSTVEEYDPVTDKWVRKADMPTARMDLSGCAANGKVYAVGGRDKDYFVVSTVEAYDPATDTWMRKTDMSTARVGLSTSVANGKIYAIGGSNGNNYFSIVEEYDPEASENVNFKGKLPVTWGDVRTTLNK